ncbi:MAG: hypothetical protein U0V75_12010 [Ferruginibacter sp.]
MKFPGSFKWLVLVVIIYSSCSEKEEKLTQKEALEFATAIEKSIAKGDASFLDKAFSKREFTKRLNLPDGDEARGYATGIMSKLTLGSQLIAALSGRDAFSFIKQYEKDGKHHIIFKIYMDKSGSLNYHDYELLKTNGQCKIADVYIYMSGETMAETLGNLYKTLDKHANETDKSFSDKDMPEVFNLKKAKELMMRGQYAEAKEVFNSLPDYLRNTKPALLMNTQICAGVSNEEYAKAIEAYKFRFPGERNISLLMIDGYYIRKDYLKMLGAINTLDSQINKDPFLDYYRYLGYNILNDDSNALASLQRLIVSMPDFEKGYLELIARDLRTGNRKSADSLAAIYKKKPGFEQEDLQQVLSLYE